MNKLWILLSCYAFLFATHANAADKSCPCNEGVNMDGISACPQANLSRSPDTAPLSMDRYYDDLAYSKQSHDLSFTRNNHPLNRSPDTAPLSFNKQQDFLSRSPDTTQLTMHRTRHDLSYSKHLNDLTISKQLADLSRSVVRHELSMSRVNDDLSRSPATAPLSRCD